MQTSSQCLTRVGLSMANAPSIVAWCAHGLLQYARLGCFIRECSSCQPGAQQEIAGCNMAQAIIHYLPPNLWMLSLLSQALVCKTGYPLTQRACWRTGAAAVSAVCCCRTAMLCCHCRGSCRQYHHPARGPITSAPARCNRSFCLPAAKR